MAKRISNGFLLFGGVEAKKTVETLEGECYSATLEVMSGVLRLRAVEGR